MNAIIDAKEKIKKLANLSELDKKEIAMENGLADNIGKGFKDKKDEQIKSTQLRKFFDEIKDIERKLKEKENIWENVSDDFHLLRPKLAYANARKLIPNDFFDLLSECMNKVDTETSNNEQKKENYKRFVNFLEAIVAYHKYYTQKR